MKKIVKQLGNDIDDFVRLEQQLQDLAVLKQLQDKIDTYLARKELFTEEDITHIEAKQTLLAQAREQRIQRPAFFVTHPDDIDKAKTTLKPARKEVEIRAPREASEETPVLKSRTTKIKIGPTSVVPITPRVPLDERIASHLQHSFPTLYDALNLQDECYPLANEIIRATKRINPKNNADWVDKMKQIATFYQETIASKCDETDAPFKHSFNGSPA